MALTAKQHKFITEYLQCFNATQAAISAGYSQNTAYSQGARLLKNVEISEAIDQHLDESAMSAKEVLNRLAKQARADIGDFLAVGESGVEVDLSYAIEHGLTDLIKKLTHKKTIRTDKDDTTTEEVFIQIELHDSHAALVDIGRHHALFTDKTENKTDATIETTVKHDLSKLSADELRAMRDMVSKLEHEDTDT
ncbi:MAG: terminase small subunit [Candidatus Competibacteraceae bacterium]|nr:terminase small subunit [Candidatus Competibacteraceae bacterium]